MSAAIRPNFHWSVSLKPGREGERGVLVVLARDRVALPAIVRTLACESDETTRSERFSLYRGVSKHARDVGVELRDKRSHWSVGPGGELHPTNSEISYHIWMRAYKCGRSAWLVYTKWRRGGATSPRPRPSLPATNEWRSARAIGRRKRVYAMTTEVSVKVFTLATICFAVAIIRLRRTY